MPVIGWRDIGGLVDGRSQGLASGFAAGRTDSPTRVLFVLQGTVDATDCDRRSSETEMPWWHLQQRKHRCRVRAVQFGEGLAVGRTVFQIDKARFPARGASQDRGHLGV